MGISIHENKSYYSTMITFTKKLYGSVFVMERRKNILQRTYNFSGIKWDIKISYHVLVMEESAFLQLYEQYILAALFKDASYI